jgi:hypothetical protein
MSTQTSTVENGTDSARRIDHDRYERACHEDMAVEPIAPNLVAVEHNDEERTVNLVGGACDCPDSLYRPETYCKHLLKAAIASIFTDGMITTVVAQVARYISNNPCPSGNHSHCDGITGPRYPCPQCVEATTAGDWAVWQLTEGRTGDRR